ncbi:GIY-YIG nuclease family protein [Marivirga salinae]|uniref:GIY-YIG nuclease family protein n=1 Tax=Marivirga salinarum TaxID=3059078 RepID=A0AA49J8I0_9BACT|nr:GIY-YIG nuclease family protein [Marivirga sp. BDSF4-3]WKK74786.1 GIY-YIG nuclease family protein [Marivirga sp. BDSF4-3]
MWYYCYVLESTIDKTTYIGSTDNLKNRLKEHNSGKTKSIKHKIPMRLIYCEAYRTNTLAIKRERSLKKNSAAKKELFSRIFDE